MEGKANVLEIPTGVFKTLQQIIKLIFIALFCWKYQEGERGQTENVTKLEGKSNVLEIPTGVLKHCSKL